MSFGRLPGSAMNTSSRPCGSCMSMSSKSGVVSSISMLVVMTRLKRFSFYIETQIDCSQSEARMSDFADGVIATEDFANQSLFCI